MEKQRRKLYKLNKMKFWNRKAGFTIIELIVVIAVIAILVLLATPKFLGYTQKAKTTQILNDVKAAENTLDST